MYLSEVKLWNFRKYGVSGEIDLNKPAVLIEFNTGINALIGENDSGKTSIIDAIKIVLNTHSKEWVSLDEYDFTKGKTRLRIELIFTNFNSAQAMHFTEYLSWDNQDKVRQPYLRVYLDTQIRNDGKFIYDIRAGSAEEGTRFIPEAREYLRTTYLKPLRDAETELVPKRNSRLSQILAGLKEFKCATDHEFEKASDCFDCYFKKYFNPAYQTERCPFPQETDNCPLRDTFSEQAESTIKQRIDHILDSFIHSDEKQATFDVFNRRLKNILEQFKLVIGDDLAGLGTHNLLFMAAELLNLTREDWTGCNLALIEELEAHLHPQAQLRVIQYLNEYCSPKIHPDNKKQNLESPDDSSAEDGIDGEKQDPESLEESSTQDDTNIEKRNTNDIQFIITTHSPNLASKLKIDQLILCHNNQVFPLRDSDLGSDDKLFLERFLDVTKANLFFAKGFILVEGWSEEIILPALARKIDCDLTMHGISIVNVGNLAWFRYAKIFLNKKENVKSLNTPVSVVTDIDEVPMEFSSKYLSCADEPSTKTKANSLLNEKSRSELLEGYENDFKQTGIRIFKSDMWTLEWCLYQSLFFSAIFKESLQLTHPNIFKNDNDCERELFKRLMPAGKKMKQEVDPTGVKDGQEAKTCGSVTKTEIAYHFADKIEKSQLDFDSIETSDSAYYLVHAIKYACGRA